MLSSYPAEKVVVSCDKCGLRKRFDKTAMLKAGGDRPLGLLLDDIATRSNCPKRQASADIYNRCGIIYPELPELIKGRPATSDRASGPAEPYDH